MKMEQTECSETSAYKIQTPGNHPKESIQHLNTCKKTFFKTVDVAFNAFFLLPVKFSYEFEAHFKRF